MMVDIGNGSPRHMSTCHPGLKQAVSTVQNGQRHHFYRILDHVDVMKRGTHRGAETVNVIGASFRLDPVSVGVGFALGASDQ